MKAPTPEQIKDVAIWFFKNLGGLAAGLSIAWGLLRHHVDEYVRHEAKVAILAPLAEGMGLDSTGTEYTMDNALDGVCWQFQEAKTRDQLFTSLSKSWTKYQERLDFLEKAVPEGLWWVDGTPYWFTGKLDRNNKPEHYRTHKEMFPDNRIYYIDPRSRKHYIWANPQD